MEFGVVGLGSPAGMKIQSRPKAFFLKNSHLGLWVLSQFVTNAHYIVVIAWVISLAASAPSNVDGKLADEQGCNSMFERSLLE